MRYEHAHEALTSTCAWSCHAHDHFIELCTQDSCCTNSVTLYSTRADLTKLFQDYLQTIKAIITSSRLLKRFPRPLHRYQVSSEVWWRWSDKTHSWMQSYTITPQLQWNVQWLCKIWRCFFKKCFEAETSNRVVSAAAWYQKWNVKQTARGSDWYHA